MSTHVITACCCSDLTSVRSLGLHSTDEQCPEPEKNTFQNVGLLIP